MWLRILAIVFYFGMSEASAKLEYYFSPGLLSLMASLDTGNAALESELTTISDNIQFTSGSEAIPFDIQPVLANTEGRFSQNIEVPLQISDMDFDDTESLFLMIGGRWRERFHIEGLLVPSISVPIEVSIPSVSQTYFVVKREASQLSIPESEELSSEQVSGNIGDVEFLFFIISGTYTPTVSSIIKPYVGGGFVLMLAQDTKIEKNQTTLSNAEVSFEDPIAPFIQLGGVLPIHERWELYLDLKRIFFESALKIDDVILDTGTSIVNNKSNFKIDFNLQASMIEFGVRYYFW